ncbi:DUF3016 domain-containing protein [Undibacterium oligocarboniphilum]|uniref:DUF3016 domain-containing protein n=1 Tax=Undibacterium oligocarboniphilum TaxID=666702 RepID=A0A850QRS6_9BURK|nr:DUF3016 domain-containing protein [Undibacterium oligocarboniphilum]MBC3871557.1 DUF3016 domain-containing protein [Undibacterium oligocarboniphilum]NVO79084.1 DUF3016 domain-containing protein [Undibacterium oligocarboniphilum]
MNRRLLAMLSVALLSPLAHAGEVSVTWYEPEKYTDIRPTNETREVFRDRVTKELGLVFADLAKKLPDDVKWLVTVTDVDLAGDVRPMMHGGMNDIRIIKDVYWPRMALQFQMTDSTGKVIAEGKEDIKDMNFMMGIRIPSGNTSFEYEEKMLHDWFKKQQRDGRFPSK